MFQWQAPPLTPWQQQEMMRRQMAAQEKNSIRKRSSIAGWICLSIIATEFIASFMDVFLGIIFTTGESFSFSQHLMDRSLIEYLFFYSLEYILMMGVPVLVGFFLIRKEDISPLYSKKVDVSFGVELIMLGFGTFICANLLSGYILGLLSEVGIKSVETPKLQDGSVSAFLINVVLIAILPAFLEEIVFRGFVLQSLRFAGDRIAIITSGVLFGLMHGTLYQIPFAIILGIVFGYIALKTGNIWMTMLLHFSNNFMAVFIEYLTFNMTDEQSNAWSMVYFGIASIIGVLGMALLMARHRTKLYPMGDNGKHFIPVKERWKITYSTGPMIAFIIVMCLFTLLTIDISGLVDSSNGITSVLPFEDSENAMIWLKGIFHG